jgi:hypothetical protein
MATMDPAGVMIGRALGLGRSRSGDLLFTSTPLHTQRDCVEIKVTDPEDREAPRAVHPAASASRRARSSTSRYGLAR